MLVQSVDSLLDLIEKEESISVLFIDSSNKSADLLYKHLNQITSLLVLFEVTADSADLLQIVKVPQLRSYKKGVEVSVKVGDSIRKSTGFNI